MAKNRLVDTHAGAGGYSLEGRFAQKKGEFEQGVLRLWDRDTLAPNPNPVTVDVGEEGVVMVPVPLTSVHVPVPTVAVFPAKVAEVLHSV